MVIDYKNNKLRKQFSNASEMQKAFGAMAKMVSRRKAEIDAAANLAILKQLPGASCHPLKGDRDGEWAVSISGNFRIIFEINQDPIPENDDGSINTILVTDIRIIETGDYH